MVRNLTPVGVGPGDTDAPRKWPKNPEDAVVNDMDSGALINELAKLAILPGKLDLTPDEQEACKENPDSLIWTLRRKEPLPRIQKGTYRGTQLALTKLYDLIEQRYVSFMDVAQVEPLIPSTLTLEDKRDFFQFTKSETDGFPPHLNLSLNKKWVKAGNEPDQEQQSTLSQTHIFDFGRLIQYSAKVDLWGVGTPDAGKTLANVEDYNKQQRGKSRHNDIFDRPNVGDLKDWYSDSRFAQQHLTGTNPTTIERASNDWIDHFIRAAKTSDDAVAKNTITELSTSCRESFYMQDYSYFRKAAGMESAADIKCEDENNKGSYRYGCASVCLFFLNEKGQLYPLAIVTDWRGSLETSVTIYNRELFKRTDIQSGSEKHDPKVTVTEEVNDWPWRYAKTCVQVSDWLRHEVTAHLTRTHLVEESIIVAANRQLEPEHAVFRLLRPHWQKTLALNGAARSTLVPSVILPIIGFQQDETLKFMQNEYRNFNFKGSYVPTDLGARRFPPEQLDTPKFHNYAYARCINSMWKKIREYVEGMLSLAYSGPDADRQVENDTSIQNWSKEMRSPDGADLQHFPVIGTFTELIDCVTMCIHLASPQHTAVNYLQDYYQDFVINKPSCLFAEPPTSLESLLRYTEDDLVKALPINHTHEWLLASHVPYILNFKPNQENETLIAYALSQWDIYRKKPNPSDVEKKTTAVLYKFYQALQGSDEEFDQYARAKDDFDDIPYNVLKTDWNAVSILI
ncbi:hypothetical protein N7460_004719 [Penicillium canescens]|uniref:Manganese lipoxygenase n=1 Tax=Penicillium canescens TaxID=5083 RepID=A0AAD6IE54_PENCN|nr:hypothetical protein N7460_004719 [Penicillium canescens]KAJ6054839.1 hypothetical protein N7444_003937 [Penicillium canescens]